DPGLGRRHRRRFRGHAPLRRAVGRATDDRDVSARASGRGLRADVERQGAIPRRADDVKVSAQRCCASQSLALAALLVYLAATKPARATFASAIARARAWVA